MLTWLRKQREVWLEWVKEHLRRFADTTPPGYARSQDRLWLDDISVAAIRIARLLGWVEARKQHNFIGPPSVMVRLTPKGRAVLGRRNENEQEDDHASLHA